MRLIESGDMVEQTMEVKKKRGGKAKRKQLVTPIVNEVRGTLFNNLVKEELINKSSEEVKGTKRNPKSQAKSQIFLNKSSDSKNRLSQKEKSKDSGEKSKR